MQSSGSNGNARVFEQVLHEFAEGRVSAPFLTEIPEIMKSKHVSSHKKRNKPLSGTLKTIPYRLPRPVQPAVNFEPGLPLFSTPLLPPPAPIVPVILQLQSTREADSASRHAAIQTETPASVTEESRHVDLEGDTTPADRGRPVVDVWDQWDSPSAFDEHSNLHFKRFILTQFRKTLRYLASIRELELRTRNSVRRQRLSHSIAVLKQNAESTSRVRTMMNQVASFTRITVLRQWLEYAQRSKAIKQSQQLHRQYVLQKILRRWSDEVELQRLKHRADRYRIHRALLQLKARCMIQRPASPDARHLLLLRKKHCLQTWFIHVATAQERQCEERKITLSQLRLVLLHWLNLSRKAKQARDSLSSVQISLARIALRRWRQYCVHKARDLMIAHVARAITLSRGLSTLLAHSREATARKAKYHSAEAFHRSCGLQRGVSRWKEWLDQRRKKKAAERIAMRRRLSRALRGWHSLLFRYRSIALRLSQIE